MKTNKKKTYENLSFVFVLLFIFILFFNTSWGITMTNNILSWKVFIDNKKEIKKEIVLDDFYYFENLDLKKRLNFQESNKKINRKLFSVVSRGENNIYDTFLVADPQEILEKGDLILSAYNFTIGRVIEIGKISKIRLFSSVGEKNVFFLKDSENDKSFDIEAEGQGAGILKVLVSRDLELSKNTVLELITDKEYLVAKLVKEEFQVQDPKRTLFFQIFANPYILDKVEVEK